MDLLPLKVLREVHTPMLDGKYFSSYAEVMQFIQAEENKDLLQHVMIYPNQLNFGVWSIKTFVFK